jgi:hypothetical protein
MTEIFKHPVAVFGLSLVLQWIAAYLGHSLRRRRKPLADADRADFTTILSATLTLLALIIGFSFSMAINRYDERKGLEEAEANAIGAEYVRALLLPQAEAAQARSLLGQYVELRIRYYEVGDARALARNNAETAKLQGELWSIVTDAAAEQSTPTVALAATGMNDVLNSRGYTQAAWWNRIPVGAWNMMFVVAFAANFLLGVGEQRRSTALLSVLPLLVSAAMFLIADIDTPRVGLIRVPPENLIALSRVIGANR